MSIKRVIASCILICVLLICCLSTVASLYCACQSSRTVADQHCHQVITLYKVFEVLQSKALSEALFVKEDGLSLLEPVVVRLGSRITAPMSLAGVVVFLSLLLWFLYSMIIRLEVAISLLPLTVRLIRFVMVAVLVLALLAIIVAVFCPTGTTVPLILKCLSLLFYKTSHVLDILAQLSASHLT